MIRGLLIFWLGLFGTGFLGIFYYRVWRATARRMDEEERKREMAHHKEIVLRISNVKNHEIVEAFMLDFSKTQSVVSARPDYTDERVLIRFEVNNSAVSQELQTMLRKAGHNV